MVKEPDMSNVLKQGEYLKEIVTRANEQQVGGAHYAVKAANNLGYLEGNVVKYVSRWKDKGGVEDLKKARHYLDKLIEVNNEKI
jgi:hypothetical protein